MSFRVNDYNAFLSSLYERGSQNIPSNQDLSIRNQQVGPPNGLPNGPPDGPQVEGCEQGLAPQSNSKLQLRSDFPMDFDFGLIPAQDIKDSMNPPDMDPAQFALETSLPDQNFDLFIPKEELPINMAIPVFRAQYNDELIQALIPSNSQIKQEPLSYNPTPILIQNDEMKLPTSSSRHSSLDTEITPYLLKQTRANSTSIQDRTNNTTQRPRAKSLHNLIEQRYRNKINDRFELLQECVPTLRVVARKLKKEDEEDDNNEDVSPPDLEGLEPARKISKGTILTKLVEYIKFLETKNLRLKQQQEELITRARMLGLDTSSLKLDCCSP